MKHGHCQPGICFMISLHTLRRYATWACLFSVFVSASTKAAPLGQKTAENDTAVDSASISIRPAYDVCVSGGGRTTAAVLNCAHEEFIFQDKRLNDAYKLLMSRLDASKKAELRSQERKWLADKKERCKLPEDAGTIDQMVSADCGVRATARRATELEDQLKK